LAFTKKQKAEMMAQYTDWLKKSQAVFIVKFNMMTMKDVDALRAKAREAGNEVHVVKNTLFGRSLDEVGLQHSETFEGSSLVGFAFSDPPSLAKVLSDAAKASEMFALKGGYMGTELLQAAQVKALADLPPLPIMRARLMGLLNTPATQITRTLAEPARRMAFLIKAHSEQPAAA
jgi:large subunit ribosomal protein L10